ncbi:MAG: phytanoyl-CoA dioxygenase family protein [Armatimonadetes bacterium]|nr:phytanoyl-CoA dioxygenase family protein [Armatimonadota bacterium]
MSSPRDFFSQNGYYMARRIFTGDQLAAMQKDFDRIVAQIVASGEDVNARWAGPEMEKMGAAGTVVLHTHNVQQYSAAWLRAFLDDAFLEAAGEHLGPDIVLHHSKLFQKPAEQGAPFPMHQDWGYFPTLKDTMLAAIVHVSHATDEMGCLRVYPGSHKEGRMEGAMGGTERLLRDFPIEGATPLEAEPGDVLFFHYCLVHGSMPNRSNQVRKTVLVQMHAGDDDVEPGCTHPNERLVLRGWNHYATRELANV